MVNYAQWRSSEAMQAMRQDPTAREHMAQCAELADGFEPHLYTVESVHSAPPWCHGHQNAGPQQGKGQGGRHDRPGITDRWSVTCADLGASVIAPNGTLVSVFGDTFSGNHVGEGDWRSPVILSAPAMPAIR